MRFAGIRLLGKGAPPFSGSTRLIWPARAEKSPPRIAGVGTIVKMRLPTR